MRYLLGVDFGASKIKTVMIDAQGRIVDQSKAKTKSTKKEIINQIVTEIEKFPLEKVSTVGIGVPGRLEKGKVINLPNISDFKNVKLKEIIEKRIKKEVILENDVNCMALGENFFGYGKKVNNFVCLAIGTGIGGGIIIDNKLYKGRGNAGELGHMIVSEKLKCSCGNYGCLEKYVLANRKLMGKRLGVGISNVIKILDPELILIGGGLSNLGDKLLKPAIAEARKRNLKLPPIKRVKLKDNAGAIGAACLTKKPL